MIDYKKVANALIKIFDMLVVVCACLMALCFMIGIFVVIVFGSPDMILIAILLAIATVCNIVASLVLSGWNL